MVSEVPPLNDNHTFGEHFIGDQCPVNIYSSMNEHVKNFKERSARDQLLNLAVAMKDGLENLKNIDRSIGSFQKEYKLNAIFQFTQDRFVNHRVVSFDKTHSDMKSDVLHETLPGTGFIFSTLKSQNESPKTESSVRSTSDAYFRRPHPPIKSRLNLDKSGFLVDENKTLLTLYSKEPSLNYNIYPYKPYTQLLEWQHFKISIPLPFVLNIPWRFFSDFLYTDTLRLLVEEIYRFHNFGYIWRDDAAETISSQPKAVT